MTYLSVISALAVPMRRSLFEALRRRPMSVHELTEMVPVSQAAVSQHLKKLREAGLVEMESDGARHVYRVRREGLAALRAYLDSFWDDALDAFAAGDAKRTRPGRKR